ncbi:hypothetical protein QOT17_004714 [Balamuthia mandrillaris]
MTGSHGFLSFYSSRLRSRSLVPFFGVPVIKSVIISRRVAGLVPGGTCRLNDLTTLANKSTASTSANFIPMQLLLTTLLQQLISLMKSIESGVVQPYRLPREKGAKAYGFTLFPHSSLFKNLSGLNRSGSSQLLSFRWSASTDIIIVVYSGPKVMPQELECRRDLDFCTQEAPFHTTCGITWIGEELGQTLLLAHHGGISNNKKRRNKKPRESA